MADKILLIDGHSILNRAFYGLPPLTNGKGFHTNAIYGFITILLKTIEEEKPSYLTVAFDRSEPTFRHKMYKEYKGTRKPMPEELREQVPVMKEVLQAMGITVVEQAGLEADDIIGTLARRCSSADKEVVVLSGDKDLLQLATDTVKIKIPKTSKGQTTIEEYYAKDVKDKYQVTPSEFIDVKALMGDSSDNIPGLPGVGEKTATKIIATYQSIENAYAHRAEVKPPRASKMLDERYDLAVLSKELATINVTADFPFELEGAKLNNIFTEEAYVYFQDLQFKNLLPKFTVAPIVNDIAKKFRVITDEKEIQTALANLKNDCFGVAYQKDIGFAISDQGEAFAVPLNNPMTEMLLLPYFVQALSKPGKFCAFDVKKLLKFHGVPRDKSWFDVSLAAYLLNPLKNDYTFQDVAQEHLDLVIDEQDPELLLCYEAYTVANAKEILRAKLKETQMDELYDTVEMPLVFTLEDMEEAGIKVDASALKEYGDKLALGIEQLQAEIYAETGEEFNINSPKQMGEILFDKLGLPHGKKTKTGYSTAAGVLEKLAPEYPVVSKILEYRQLAKLKSTYADGLANYIGSDGRIHGTFNQTITATGRISSTEPNLQNIPIRMELGRLIRKVFIPEPGYTFVDADYSQIELRILAHYSGDEQLISAYKEAEDIHRLTAAKVFHVPFEEVTELQRRNAKAVNFGIVYGISAHGLSEDLSITRKEAQEYIENYFQTYPGIKKFLDGQVEKAKADGYVTTLFHRRRPVPELKSSNFNLRSFGERVAMNAPIQGTAADIMKIAMIQVNEAIKSAGLKSRLLLQVHDELLIEAYESEVEQVKEILHQHMERAVTLEVPLVIDIGIGHNWYEAK
ncbi:DNA polymerase-1 [Lachnospiraceae bacterium PF1-21]